MKRVLVTGGAGFIGSQLVKRLHERFVVTVLDDFSTGNPVNLEGISARIIEGSVLDGRLVEALTSEVDYVVHLAAMVSVGQSIKNPKRCHELNLTSLLNIAEASVRASVEKLVFASSSAVYGNSTRPRQGEADLPLPLSPYGVTKLAGEHYLASFRQTHSLKSVSLRLFNVFGPGQPLRGSESAVIPIFSDLAARGESIPIHGDGEQTRDFIHVFDVARIFEAAMVRDEVEDVVNVGTGRGATINELAFLISQSADGFHTVAHSLTRVGDVRHSVADVSRLRSHGLQGLISLEEGIQELLALRQGTGQILK